MDLLAVPSIQTYLLAMAVSEDSIISIHLHRDIRFRIILQHAPSSPVSRVGLTWLLENKPAAWCICTGGRADQLIICCSASFYRQYCPAYKQRTYTIRSGAYPDGDLELEADGQARIHQFQVLLAGSDDGCIRIRGEPFDDEYVLL